MLRKFPPESIPSLFGREVVKDVEADPGLFLEFIFVRFLFWLYPPKKNHFKRKKKLKVKHRYSRIVSDVVQAKGKIAKKI